MELKVKGANKSTSNKDKFNLVYYVKLDPKSNRKILTLSSPIIVHNNMSKSVKIKF